jgi:hypothetical protein
MNEFIDNKDIDPLFFTTINPKNIFDEKHITQVVILSTNNDNDTKSISAEKLLLDSKFGYENLLIILFQIMYTLKCFQLIGLKHNDLRLGNIIIEERKKKIVIDYDNNTCNKYKIGDKEYNIPNINYTVKIFDFDLSEKFPRDNVKDEYKKINGFRPINYSEIYSHTYLNNYDDIIFDVLKLIHTFIDTTNKNLQKLFNSFFNYPDFFQIMKKLYK